MPDSLSSPAALPRPLRIGAIALAAVLLTTFFIYLGFPYEALVDRMGGHLERATGLRLDYGPVAASPQLQGPGIRIENLRARTRGGGSWDFSELMLRPAWSLSWLSGDPSLYLDGDAAFGRIRGVARLGGAPRFDGEGSELDLAALLRAAGASGGVTGSADLRADLGFGPDGAEGPVTLTARDGVISHASLPLDVPYQQIDGVFALGGDNAAEIVSLDITSPMGTGRVSGTIGRARVLARSTLQLAVQIKVAENMVTALRAQRVRIAPDGTIALTIRGTLSRPVVR